LGQQELALGQPRQKAVLVRLALQANQTVSRDQLVDAVWGEDPPATAVNGVHTYVARLRRAVEPDRTRRSTARLLVGHGSGYMLRLEPGTLDLNVFAERLTRARDALSADAFVEALGLWRGTPFSGVPGPFVEAERARVTELRLSALEDLAGVRLSSGRHVEVAADLSALVREHPLRERLRALEILALYRSGRQADALLAYADVRRLLADELGVEPGRPLQKLYHDILVGEPSLEVPPLEAEIATTSDHIPTAPIPDAAPATAQVAVDTSVPVAVADSVGPPRGRLRIRRSTTRRSSVRLAALTAVVVVVVGGVILAGRSRAPADRPAVHPTVAAVVPAANATSGPLVPGDNSRFVADVTIPDGAPVHVGQPFTKVWEIQNTGTVEWRDRYLLRQGILAAPGLCSSPARVPLATTPPAGYLRISVTFVAPTLPGSCRVDWKMADAQGRLAFPNKQGLYVIVSVVEQAPPVPPTSP
jgi:DNA-binding SARP family transcriptional activator